MGQTPQGPFPDCVLWPLEPGLPLGEARAPAMWQAGSAGIHTPRRASVQRHVDRRVLSPEVGM